MSKNKLISIPTFDFDMKKVNTLVESPKILGPSLIKLSDFPMFRIRIDPNMPADKMIMTNRKFPGTLVLSPRMNVDIVGTETTILSEEELLEQKFNGRW